MPNDSDAAVTGGHGRLALAAKALAIVAGVVFVLLFPSMVADPFALSVGVVVMSYAVLATSWNFVGGFTGYISLGHAAYSGLGAYATGLLILKADVPSFAAMFLAGLSVAVIAVPVNIAALRVRGASFVIVSIALVLILLLVFQSWARSRAVRTGSACRARSHEVVLRPEQHERFFYLHAVLLALASHLVGDRPVAVREGAQGDPRGRGQGTVTRRAHVQPTSSRRSDSAFFTALGGGLYALWFGFLDPIFQFSILVGAYMVLMALLGGVRSLFGPLLGAVIVGYAWSCSSRSTATRSSTWSPRACCSAWSSCSCPTGSSRPP